MSLIPREKVPQYVRVAVFGKSYKFRLFDPVWALHVEVFRTFHGVYVVTVGKYPGYAEETAHMQPVPPMHSVGMDSVECLVAVRERR